MSNPVAVKQLADRAAWVHAQHDTGCYTDESLPPSPCVSVCRMDDEAGVCQGCLRTLDELRAWSTANAAQRLGIWLAVTQRLQQRHPQAWQQAVLDADAV